MARGGAQKGRENGRQRSFKFNLSEHAPTDVWFELRGKEYRVTGDPDVEVWKLMLRIDMVLRDESAADEDMALSDALATGKQLILDLIREHDPDVADIRLGVTEMLAFFSYMTGGPSVAHATAHALTGGVDAMRGDEGDEIDPDLLLEDDEDKEADVAPLASAKPSSARSRRSRASTSGSRAGG